MKSSLHLPIVCEITVSKYVVGQVVILNNQSDPGIQYLVHMFACN